MPTFQVTAPDGSTYEVNAPEGATEDDAVRYVQSQHQASAPEQPKTNRTSALEAGLQGVGQGLTFGFSDEIGAGAAAAGRKLLGDDKDLGALYDENVTSMRDRINASSEEHPIAYYGGEIGSSLAVPGGLTRLGIRGAARAVGGTLRQRMAAGAAEGAAYGGAYGAGKSEGGIEDRVAGAAGGAAMGGAFGGVAPAVIDAAVGATAPVRNAVRSITNPTAEAARRVGNAVDDDFTLFQNRQMSPDEYQRRADAGQLVNQNRAGQDLRNIDLAGENTRALARSAANNSPEARQTIVQSNAERFEGQSRRAAEFLRGLVPLQGNAARTREAIQDASRRARAPLYRAAYQEGDRPIWSPELEQLTSSPIVVKAMKDAVVRGKDRAVLDGYGGFNPGVSVSDTGTVTFNKGPTGVPTYPNLQYWDYVKREVDDVANTAVRGGRNEEATVARSLARNLRDELDRQVGSYAQARGVAAHYFGAEDALEAGQVFARGTTPVHDATRAIGRMSRAEQEAFREGFVSELVDSVSKSGDRRTILGKLAGSEDQRARLTTALGPNRARELEGFMYLEQLMDLPRQAMGNSTTARQLAELGLAGGTGMLVSGGFNPTDPTFWVTSALTWAAQRGNARVSQDMARRIADMLVSNDEAVFRQGVNQVAHGPMLRGLRNLMTALGRPAQQAVPGLVGGTVAAQQATERLNTTEGHY